MEFKLSDLSGLSSATKAFVERAQSLLGLTGAEHPYYSIPAALEAKKNFPAENRAVLTSVLREQYRTCLSESGKDRAVSDNIGKLLLENTYTVSTGQQLHLFFGPAFVLYKILSVIRLARDLRLQYPEKNFVPVYWMASEDHDFDEIRDNVVFKKNFPWQTTQSGACGRFDTSEVTETIAAIRAQLQLNEDNLSLLQVFEDIYLQSASLAEATRKTVHHFFAEDGLICADGDHPALKALFAPVMRRDILEQANVSVFNDFSQKMEMAGFSTQLHARDINVFYLDRGIRSRILKEDQHYRVQNTDIRFSLQELDTALQTRPECFSPNALLRPLYQESILPNIAYVGGNAEINYWLQGSGVFALNGVAAPCLFLRPSVWITGVKIMQWLNQVHISPLDLLKTNQEEKLVQMLDPSAGGIEHLITEFAVLRKNIQDEAARNGFRDLSALSEAGKVYDKFLKQSEKKIREIQMEKTGAQLVKLKDIFHMYFDIKQMQERKLHALELLLKYPDVTEKLRIHAALQPALGYIIAI